MTSDASQLPGRMTAWTLSAIKQRNLALEGYCQTEGCNNFYVFDLDGLICSAGPDYVLPEILPGITCLACGGVLKAKLAMMPPGDDEGGAGACDSDINVQLQFFEAQAEHFYAKIYDATDQTTATGHYSNAKEALHTAIGLAEQLEDPPTVQRLQDRLAHVKAVFRSQFG